jgi:hypothetical protein
MYVKSISVTDYSTGSQYTYTDHSGTWQSIKAVGGSVNGNGQSAVPVSTAAADPPATTSVTGTQPIPFTGTHRDASSSGTSSVFPWVSGSTSVLSGSTPSGFPASSGASVSEASLQCFVLPLPSLSTDGASLQGSSQNKSSSLSSSNSSASGSRSGQLQTASSTATVAPPTTAAAIGSFRADYALGIICVLTGSAIAWF